MKNPEFASCKQEDLLQHTGESFQNTTTRPRVRKENDYDTTGKLVDYDGVRIGAFYGRVDRFVIDGKC